MFRQYFSHRLCILGLLAISSLGGEAVGREIWIGVWQSSPVKGFYTKGKEAKAAESAQSARIFDTVVVRGTISYRMRVSLGGERFRLRLSNELGADPLPIGAATVALASAKQPLVPTSLRPVTFASRRSVRITGGGIILSDPINLKVSGGQDVIVKIYFPPEGAELVALPDSPFPFVTGRDVSAELVTPGSSLLGARPVVSGIDMLTRAGTSTLVALGDSITEGFGLKEPGVQSWPARLADRILRRKGLSIAVVNAGISGNRLMASGMGPAGIARFDRDVAAVPGARFVVLALGINDVGFTDLLDLPYQASGVAAAEDLIPAYQQIVSRAHDRGLKVFGTTLTPCKGFRIAAYCTAAKEAIRQNLNKWIRTAGAFDAVIDFDAALRDPKHPNVLSPKFDSGDHLHPNDLGENALAEAVDLSLLRDDGRNR